MRRTTLLTDPTVVAIALIAGAVALLLGAGAWALLIAGAALAASAIVGPLSGVVASVRTLVYLDSQELAVRRRAHSAVRTARRLNRSAPSGPIAERFRVAEVQLEASADGIDRLIRRAMAVRRLRNGLDQGATTRVNAVILDLRSRAQTLVESLESVVARQIEVLALADGDPAGNGLAALERLGIEVDGLRAGLDEAQSLGGELSLNKSQEETR